MWPGGKVGQRNSEVILHAYSSYLEQLELEQMYFFVLLNISYCLLSSEKPASQSELE